MTLVEKVTRAGMPGLSAPPLRRKALCAIAYTPEEFETLQLGAAPDDITTPYFIFEEDGKLHLCSRSEKKVEYVALFEPRGAWIVLHSVRLADDETDRREVHPADVDVVARVWMAIERCLLKRFPEDDWCGFMDSFRVTPETDDPSVPMGIYERATLFAIRAYFKKNARTCEKT
jgi:hypothetical protein